MTQNNVAAPKDGPEGRDSFAPAELASVFARQWRWIAVTFAIVALAIIAALSQAKPRWESQATIRIGQVYDVLTDATRTVEPVQDVLERMREKSFLRDALKSKGVSPDDATLNELFAGYSVESVPSTGLIRIRARSSSPDDATNIAMALFDRLSSTHRELMQEARSGVELLAQQYMQDLANLRETQSGLQKAFSSAIASAGEGGSMALATLASAMERNAGEIRELDRRRFILLQRNQRQLIPTQMMGEVSTVKIVSIRKSLVVAFALVMGLAAGLVVGLLRDYFVRMRSRRLFV